ncbi:MAG: DUF1292 domain-containing protein [Clostridia bacterium]|nr:DUF1292 domain-containing protein [Clostridia bacterium]
MTELVDNKMVIVNENGEEVTVSILFTTNLEGYTDDYVVFVEDDTDVISAARYVPTSDTEGEFLPIESDDEWEKLQELLDKYDESYGDEDDE